MNTENSKKSRTRVAVVEDEAFIVESLRFLLERNGMEVKEGEGNTSG